VRIPCPQCGGEVQLRDPEGFPACPFCGAGLVLDRTGVRPHVLYRPRVTPAQVLPLLRRWAERRGMSASPGLEPPRLVYYPFWRYAREGPRRLVPAWSTVEMQWAELRLPEAEQVSFDAAQVRGAVVVEPTVPEAAARERGGGEGSAPEGDLVHLPAYEATMRLGGARLPVTVEACSGTVVCAGALGAEGTRAAAIRRAAWMVAGGLLVLAVGMTIRPFAIAAAASAALAVLLCGVLASEGRGSGR
jgi:hypothetical protein